MMKMRWPICAVGLYAATSLQGALLADDDGVIELEAFIVEETAARRAETLNPLSSSLDGAFGAGRSVMDVPRGLSVLNSAHMALLGIDDYAELARYGAGTQRVNYFGLAGSAFLRGARAGTYFDGMLRAYQRNEMPMSFGAFDALEIVRGPVPAAYAPTMVGGYVNQRPKAPYFDRQRGRVEAQVGSDRHGQLDLDVGGPLMLAGNPAAYRLSATVHRSERYFDNVPNDFESLYGAIKMKLDARTRLRLAGESYRYRSREIAGVNRPTQALIDEGAYVIGEPVGLTGEGWGGTVVRPLLEFPYSLAVNPQLWALAVDGATARAALAPELLATLRWLGDPAQLEALYRTQPPEAVPPDFQWTLAPVNALLAQVERVPVDAYQYTPEYFAAGGTALTVPLPRRSVLADPEDRADANNHLLFAEWERRLDGDRTLRITGLGEWLDSDKASSYGFAMATAQAIAHLKAELAQWLEPLNLALRTGIELRYSRARMLQDFDAEPFSRRDISLPGIGDNTRVYAGAQRGPDGLNYWSSFGGASQDSRLLQVAAYAMGQVEIGERLALHGGLRLEAADWRSASPGPVDRADADRRAQGTEALWTAHLNPIYTIGEQLALYGALQWGRALAPADGGTIAGPDSFTDVELYEAGAKFKLWEGRFYGQISGYGWEQSTLSPRDAAARPLRGQGLEIEWTALPTERLTLLGSFTAQRVELRADSLGFGAFVFDAAGWALNGGLLNAGAPRPLMANSEGVFAGYPEVSANLYAVLDLGGGLEIGAGPYWRDGYWHDMQRQLRIPGVTLWNAHIAYHVGDWSLRLRIDNLLDRDYWVGQEPVFSAGTLILRGAGRQWRASIAYQF